jgi:ABC-type multidrug transport system fused ATPase/permease subunit
MVFTNPWMAGLGMVLFPVQVFFVRKLQRRVSQLSRERVRLVRGLSDRIQESVGGIQEIYVNDTTAYEAGGYRGHLQRIFRVRLSIYNLKYLIKWINNFLEKFGQFLLLMVGGWLIVERPGSFDVGALVAFLQAYGQLNEPWRELINYFQGKENARVKYEQVIANFDPPGLRPEFPLDEAGSDGLPALQGAYELRQATVILDGTTTALDRLSTGIAAREHVAVVGTVGSGRSTLAFLLAKLHPYTGTVQLDGRELGQAANALIGRQLAYVGPDARLFATTVFDNVIYGLRHRPRNGSSAPAGEDGEWLDLEAIGVADRAGLVVQVLEVCRVVGLDDDLFAFGLRATIDPKVKPEVASRLLLARRLVMERFAAEGGEPAVEFFDRARFSAYASIGENILFGHGQGSELTLENLADHPHFRQVVADVGLEASLLQVGANVAKDMVEIFKDIPAGDELFANFSLIAEAELPEYTRLVARLDRIDLAEGLPDEARNRLLTLALRLVPARHRLGKIDEAFMAKVVAARHRFTETLPAELARRFEPYDREQYFADGTLLENILFGKVVATSSLAVKRVNALVEEVIAGHNLRAVVMETGLDYHVGLGGGRVSAVQRQKVVLARALLKRPHVLILDGALGVFETERRAETHQRLLEVMKGFTVVAVVERVDLARHYDRVVVLDAGRVAEVGTYQELTAREGLFHHLLVQAGLSP